MGALISCYGKKEKTKDQYYHEIFDGLDIDGSQTLDAKELQTIWEKVKEQKLSILNKQLNDYIVNKQQEISDTNKLDSSSLIPNGKKFDIKAFISIMKSLDMPEEDIHNFWVRTKESEIHNLQEVLKKYR
tara:strand:- start:1258 stop:1647 length:390 start_codon:yes stop_codon:yes gene_type:complete